MAGAQSDAASRTLKRPAVVTIGMSLLSDELAGVVDLFGGLTREELRHALEEQIGRAS